MYARLLQRTLQLIPENHIVESPLDIYRSTATVSTASFVIPRSSSTPPPATTSSRIACWWDVSSSRQRSRNSTLLHAPPSASSHSPDAEFPTVNPTATFRSLTSPLLLNDSGLPSRGSKLSLLALDGGGIRGLITIEVLARLEETLAKRYPREQWEGDEFRLSDYFDYVAGTSTGAIIATCISLGMSVSQVRQFYLGNGSAMFDKASLLRRFRYKFEDDAIAAKLQTVFHEYLPANERRHGDVTNKHLTLGSSALKTLLLVVMRNATTDSPWPVSSNPDAKFNDRSRGNCNLDIPLWQLVRASTAAPTYFPPEQLTLGAKTFLFVDGGVTPYNNPAFLLFLMSTVGAYRLNWESGYDRMLLVSIGSGVNRNANAGLAQGDMNLI